MKMHNAIRKGWLRIALIVVGFIVFGAHSSSAQAIKVGKTLLIASGSHGKFVSRLDLDVQNGAVKGFRYKLIPLFADAIKPDAAMTATIREIEAEADEQGAAAVSGG